jgi:hypothetical protein
MTEDEFHRLPLRAQEALHEIMECVTARFTGSLQFEFNDGVPQLRRRTETKRYGKELRRGTLTPPTR